MSLLNIDVNNSTILVVCIERCGVILDVAFLFAKVDCVNLRWLSYVAVYGTSQLPLH